MTAMSESWLGVRDHVDLRIKVTACIHSSIRCTYVIASLTVESRWVTTVCVVISLSGKTCCICVQATRVLSTSSLTCSIDVKLQQMP